MTLVEARQVLRKCGPFDVFGFMRAHDHEVLPMVRPTNDPGEAWMLTIAISTVLNDAGRKRGKRK